MTEPDELVDAPEYKWRKWWAKASIPSTVILFMILLALTNIVIAVIGAGVVYAAISAKVRDLDALQMGAERGDFDAVVEAALERQRQTGDDGRPTAPSDISTVDTRPSTPSASFGRKAGGHARKPVQLPRRLH